jgi:PPOX class probable F420-dependent enzyme
LGNRPCGSGFGSTWNGSQFLVLSIPNQAKLVNIARYPRMALHFNSTFHGGDVAIFTGAAELDPAGFAPEERTVYTEKYRDGIASIGLTPEGMYSTYSQLIRITPETLRGFQLPMGVRSEFSVEGRNCARPGDAGRSVII